MPRLSALWDYRKPKFKKSKVHLKNRVMAYAKTYGSSGNGVYEIVRYHNRTYRCTCPDNLYRYPKRCKHIRAFIEYEVLQKALR